jgi:hypothetical protein
MPSTGRAAVIAGWDLDGPAPRHPTKLCTDHRAELLDGSKKDGLRWSAGSLPVLSAAHSHLELINFADGERDLITLGSARNSPRAAPPPRCRSGLSRAGPDPLACARLRTHHCMCRFISQFHPALTGLFLFSGWPTDGIDLLAVDDGIFRVPGASHPCPRRWTSAGQVPEWPSESSCLSVSTPQEA